MDVIFSVETETEVAHLQDLGHGKLGLFRDQLPNALLLYHLHDAYAGPGLPCYSTRLVISLEHNPIYMHFTMSTPTYHGRPIIIVTGANKFVACPSHP